MPQLTLGLSFPTLYGVEHYLPSACNEDAYGWVMRWPDWPGNALIISGESGSGKTHLGHIWANRASAEYLSADNLPDSLPSRAMVIDRLETLLNEEMLFHLLNHAKSEQLPLLLLSAKPAGLLSFKLADLRSRLLALPAAQLDVPDDALLAGVLRKQFADRQLKVDDGVIDYFLPRIERSLAAISALVGTLDEAALAQGKPITIPFVRQILHFS